MPRVLMKGIQWIQTITETSLTKVRFAIELLPMCYLNKYTGDKINPAEHVDSSQPEELELTAPPAAQPPPRRRTEPSLCEYELG